MSDGFVYVLINPSFPEFVKIGKTTKSPEERAKEISSSTGVPTPFFVAYQIYVNNIDNTENYFHQLFADFRVNDGREFFSVPLHKVVDAMFKYNMPETHQNKTNLPTVPSDFKLDSKINNESEPFFTFFNLAEKYNYGLNNEIINKREALTLYKKAIKLGSLESYAKVGQIYSHGIKGSKSGVNLEKAKEFFFEGANKGSGKCWAELGIISLAEFEEEEADKCFTKFFSSQDWLKPVSIKDLNILERDQYFYLSNFIIPIISSFFSELIEELKDNCFNLNAINPFFNKKLIKNDIFIEITKNIENYSKYLSRVALKVDENFPRLYVSKLENYKNKHPQIYIYDAIILNDGDIEFDDDLFDRIDESSYGYIYEINRKPDMFLDSGLMLDSRLSCDIDLKIYKESCREIVQIESIMEYAMAVASMKKMQISLYDFPSVFYKYVINCVQNLLHTNTILAFENF